MEILEIILISISLAMDAFAVSICKGLSMSKIDWKKGVIIGLYFGIFQALMPTIGYFLGTTFETLVTSFDHWIIFILLFVIGGNMILESFSQSDENDESSDINFSSMVVLAIATSIDALAVGITFAFMDINIFSTVSLIGLITFVLTVIGVKIGNKFGNKYESKAKLLGGIILILIGVKILFEHLQII